MGLFGRRSRKPSPVRVTAEQLGTMLLRIANDNAKDIDDRLRETGLFDERPGLLHSLGYQTNLALFGMFPLDVIVNRVLGASALSVREAMRSAFIDAAVSQPESALTCEEWEVRIGDQFHKYAQAWQSRPGPDGLQGLSFAAYEEITGESGVDPWGASHLAIQFAGVMKHMPQAIGQYQIIR